MSPGDYDLTVKVIVLGDYSAKAGRLLQALQALPKEDDVCVLGSSMGVTDMLFVRDGRRIRAKLHHTAGQERFRSVTSSFYRGAHGCLLVFDVTNKETFDHLMEWKEEVKSHTANDEVVTMLVGSNSDRPGRQVSRQTAQQFARFHGLQYEEVSLQIIGSVLHVLQTLLDQIVVRVSLQPTFYISIRPLPQTVHLGQQPNKQQDTAKTSCSCS